jgi:hypothetical protein
VVKPSFGQIPSIEQSKGDIFIKIISNIFTIFYGPSGPFCNMTLCGFAICGPNLFLFADLKLTQVRKYIAYNAMIEFIIVKIVLKDDF